MSKSRKNRSKQKGRKEEGSFIALPHALINSVNYSMLSHTAAHMLICIAAQYYGKNNGYLKATKGIMDRYGWKSSDTRVSAIKELIHYGFIVKNFQGYEGVPSLYAITWQPIDEQPPKERGRHTTSFPSSKVSLGYWKKTKTQYVKAKKKKRSELGIMLD